jgi:hypothetical protein
MIFPAFRVLYVKCIRHPTFYFRPTETGGQCPGRIIPTPLQLLAYLVRCHAPSSCGQYGWLAGCSGLGNSNIQICFSTLNFEVLYGKLNVVTVAEIGRALSRLLERASCGVKNGSRAGCGPSDRAIMWVYSGGFSDFFGGLYGLRIGSQEDSPSGLKTDPFSRIFWFEEA